MCKLGWQVRVLKYANELVEINDRIFFKCIKHRMQDDDVLVEAALLNGLYSLERMTKLMYEEEETNESHMPVK